MIVWLVIKEGRQFGITADVYDHPVLALEDARAAMAEELEHRGLSAPARLTVCCNFFSAEHPYYARSSDDGLTVTVNRKEVKT